MSNPQLLKQLHQMKSKFDTQSKTVKQLRKQRNLGKQYMFRYSALLYIKHRAQQNQK